MKSSLFFSFLTFCIFIYGQETYTFTYPIIRLDLNHEIKTSFLTEIKKIEAETIDSILLIGKSDSVGTFLSNFRTTELRAQKLKKQLAQTFKRDIPYAIYPTAGNWVNEPNSKRKIQIVFYTSEISKPIKKEAEIPTGCYQVAYSELQTYHITNISKGKKSITRIERSLSKTHQGRLALFSGSLNKNNEFTANPLTWKKEKTGKAWWGKEQEVTEIPTEDYDRFKIFYIQNEPCTNCHENFQKNKEIVSTEMVLATDCVAMENVQHKTPILSRNTVSIRIPKEFIDPELNYYTVTHHKIEWREKDKDYYYAKVSQSNGEIAPIQRKFSTHKDTNCRQSLEQSKPLKTIIGPSKSKFNFYNFAELGIHFQNSTQLPYASFGLFSATKIVDLEFLVGLHAKAAFYGAIRARYNILTIPIGALIAGGSWRKTLPSNRFWYSRLYIGSEYKGSIGKRSDNYLEPNFHVGLTFSKNAGSVFHRIFVQYGRGVNFIEESPRNSYNLLQFGMQLQLGKTTYQFERGIL